MKTALFFLIMILGISGLTNAQDRLTANKEKTKLAWLGEKVLGQHTGTINLQSGWLIWEDNQITSGKFLIDMASLKSDENIAKLEAHLKSDDFFGVDKHPVSELVITGSTAFDKGTGIVTGKLTIKGTTNPVEFQATIQQAEEGTWFYANIIVDRSKYNVRYGSGSFFDNLGDKTIYNEFKLKVNLLVQKL
jgi:polyisoprenoid-binding protein YceI